MKNKLLDYFSALADLSAGELQAIEESMLIRTFPKGHELLREGQTAKESYFVLEGCVRQFVRVDGQEKTTQFFMENDWIISMESLATGQSAHHSWTCNEACILVAGNEEREKQLFEQQPNLVQVARVVMEKLYAEQQQRMELFYSSSPEERYRKLLQQRSPLLQRVPQYQLASYLGMTPETLSRIRRKIATGD